MRNFSRKTIVIPGIIAILMFSFSFAVVPIYNALCKVTGLNTALPIALAPPDFNRAITVQFVTATNQNLAWDFFPLKHNVNVHPDENTKIFFYFKNKTSQRMTVQAIPSITPGPAVAHFHKLECFCFSQQTLNPNQEILIPMVFRIDKTIDPDVTTVTLGYTLFAVTHPTKKVTT